MAHVWSPCQQDCVPDILNQYMSTGATLYEHIAERIKSLRLGINMSQEALAKATGVATNTISRWETGAYKPAIVDLDRLARFFSVSVLEFFPDQDASKGAMDGLLRAAKDLPESDLLELKRYAEFRRARSLLESGKPATRRSRARDQD